MTNFAQSTSAPGVVQLVELQRGQGLANVPLRVALVGYRSALATADFDNIPTVIADRAEGQTKFGPGQLDLMIKGAFDTGELARQAQPVGGTPEIVAVALAPPPGPAVASVYTMTVSGPATAQGVIDIEVSDLAFSITTLDGETPTEIAIKINDRIAVLAPDLPVTAGEAVGVVTLTARDLGEWGNDLYLSCDTTEAPGVGCVIAQSVTGAGVVDIVPALDALQEQQFIGAYAVGQSDTVTRAAVLADVKSAWVFTTDRPRIGMFPVIGDISDGQTDAAALDDYRVAATVAEKFVGVGQPWSGSSARSMAAVLNAAMASREFSRTRPNANFNNARIAGVARPGTMTRDDRDDAIQGGITVLIDNAAGASILKPTSTAVTDQTAGGSGPDNRWGPLEIARTVQAIWWQVRAILDKFTQADRTQETAAQIKAASIGLLRQFERDGVIGPITDDSAIVVIDLTPGGSTQALVTLSYGVLTNISVVAVTHKVQSA